MPFIWNLDESCTIKRLHDPNCWYGKLVKIIYKGAHMWNSWAGETIPNIHTESEKRIFIGINV